VSSFESAKHADSWKMTGRTRRRNSISQEKKQKKPDSLRVETEDRERRNMNIRRFGDERRTEKSEEFSNRRN